MFETRSLRTGSQENRIRTWIKVPKLEHASGRRAEREREKKIKEKSGKKAKTSIRSRHEVTT